jgi:hypothetical protein
MWGREAATNFDSGTLSERVMPENSRGKRQDRARATGRRNLSDPDGGFLTKVVAAGRRLRPFRPHGDAEWVASQQLDLITTKQPAA